MKITMMAGEMPTREQFDQACARPDEDTGRSVDLDGFGFGNDRRLGTTRLSSDELWDALCSAMSDYEQLLQGHGDDPEPVGDWISTVLSCLGFEWV